MKFSLKKIRRTIPAGSQSDIDVYGDKVFAYSVPSGAKISFDNGEAVELRTGLRYGSSSGLVAALVAVLAKASPKVAGALSEDVFQKISIINENAFEITVEILAGFGDIADDSTTISNVVPTKEKGWRVSLSGGSSNLAAGSSIGAFRDMNVPMIVIVDNYGLYPVYIGRPAATYAEINGGRCIRLAAGEKASIPCIGGLTVWSKNMGAKVGLLGLLQDS